MKITTRQTHRASRTQLARRMGNIAFSYKNTHKRSKKEIIKPLALYASAFVLLMSVVAVGYHQPDTTTQASVAGVSATRQAVVVDSAAVDQKTATDLAANFAIQTDMPVAPNVANLATSLEAKQEIAQTDDSIISKPQIVQPTAGARTITSYKAKTGDSVQAVADQFNLTPQTIKWANNLTSDALEDGRDLVIPPVDGVVYTTKEGDTPEAIAERYGASAERIVVFNDLESGIKPDTRIVIPSGELPEDQRPGYQPPVASTTSTGYVDRGGTGGSVSNVRTSNARASAGNAYAFGNCTWYAYERRAQLGRGIGSFWGNASTWAMNGAAAGFAVNKTPAPGAIMQNGGGYAGYGHVAIVETVHPDGSITVSEMNYVGFNVVSNRTVSAGEINRYNFIH